MSVNGIVISDCIIFPIRNKPENSSLKAYARIIINDGFIINGIRVFEGRDGPFIRFPQEYNKQASKGYDIAFPLTSELRSYINDQVLSQYSLALSTQ